MKAKLTHKDLILLIGIVVALVIAFSTWVYRDMRSNTAVSKPQEIKTNLHSSLIQKLIKRTESVVLPKVN